MNFNKRRCTLLVILVFTITLSSFVSSEGCEASGFMGQFLPDENVTITQACPTCSYLNITITDPDSIEVFSNVPMTLANGIFSFGPNNTISSKNGTYFVQGVSNLNAPFKSCYIIQKEEEISTGEALVYIILTAVVFLMFLFCIWGSIGLPARNRRNELNRVIRIEIWKYPKVGLMFLAYAFFTWFINILLILSSNLVTLKQFQAFFTMIFQILMAGLYVVFVAMIIIFFVLGAKDLKLRDFLTRGIQPR